MGSWSEAASTEASNGEFDRGHDASDVCTVGAVTAACFTGTLTGLQETLDSLATLFSRDSARTGRPDAAAYATVPEIQHRLGIAASSDRVRLRAGNRA